MEKVAVVDTRQQMKRMVETTSDKPNQILAAVASQLPDAVSVLLPSEDTCRRRYSSLLYATSDPGNDRKNQNLLMSYLWMFVHLGK